MALPSKSRLTEPLVRENGGHRPATWDEALEAVTALDTPPASPVWRRYSERAVGQVRTVKPKKRM
jgi:predicted molibdopterin-dependent oxidoreductase YjgC